MTRSRSQCRPSSLHKALVKSSFVRSEISLMSVSPHGLDTNHLRLPYGEWDPWRQTNAHAAQTSRPKADQKTVQKHTDPPSFSMVCPHPSINARQRSGRTQRTSLKNYSLFLCNVVDRLGTTESIGASTRRSISPPQPTPDNTILSTLAPFPLLPFAGLR